MAENSKDDIGELEKLALIADSLQSMFKGKTMVVVESEKDEYKKMINHFREIDRHHKRFTIEISGTDFVFILDDGDES